jgi:FkbM family methyltransferase
MKGEKLLVRASRRLQRIYLEKFKVHSIRNLEKLGTWYGGWTVPKDFFNPDSVCYLAGAGEDISFDAVLADKHHPQIHIFDPTPRAISHYEEFCQHVQTGERMPINNSLSDFYQFDRSQLPCLHFHDIGLWNKDQEIKFYAPDSPTKVSHSILNLQHSNDYFIGKVKRLKNIMKFYGHKSLDLLKVDIEGAEYEVVNSIVEDQLDIKVIDIAYDEFTKPQDSQYLKRIMASVNKLLRYGYKLVYIDPLKYKTCFLRNDVFRRLA